ncbi:N-acetylmuramic acid 6-phosphate etherase [Granulicella aggregans]|uniref:N-acetylmuramic acid 6-phosphate etherase n=1 Tax=Granulicella aggregans TaxID=474949 RepID=A0A7W7ZEA5_9BACT|nr:N-acetylmuramic acid 6-phosphate etherase [Granulicella aggregans]MBB5058283.1 N-acetylmuramic acid 6-phosphate etherase [Granulicella aggregans]
MIDGIMKAEDKEVLATAPTEARNPNSLQIDKVSTLEMLSIINREDQTVAAAVERVIPHIAQAVDAIAERLSQGGRLFYVGAGTSGRLGVLDASECPPTFSIDPEIVQGLIAGGDGALRRSSEVSEDSPELGAADLRARNFASGHPDVLVGIAASGRTPYVLGAMAYAKSLGALTIAVTCVPVSAMTRFAEISIAVQTGAEVITGSTRMKAGTATKLVLNMLSTGVMVRTGAVYGNLMVNLKPTNSKLVDRAQRIIMTATGCTHDRAVELLLEGGTVKTAIVIEKLEVDRTTAEARLSAANGRLSAALGE